MKKKSIKQQFEDGDIRVTTDLDQKPVTNGEIYLFLIGIIVVLVIYILVTR